MSTSTDSRRSSLFSLHSTAVSSIPSEELEGFTEKRELVPSPVLNWKPLLFSTAFTTKTSTILRFTLFPPVDLKTPLFEHLSTQTAEAMLHNFRIPATMSFLMQPDAKVRCVDHIPFPTTLPRELIQLLGTPDWEYFHITENMVSVGICNFRASLDHHVAIRSVKQGLERYIFGPSGLCVHSVCCIEDIGKAFEDPVPRETLILHEEAEVVCNKFLRWWAESLITTETTAAHDRFRQEWDANIRNRWTTIKTQQRTDLLV